MKGQNCMISDCDAVKTGYPDHRFKFKNVDKNGRIYRKESCVNFFFFFAEICWIFVSEGYIG